MAELGRLKQVELRDIWENEAQHFTPWLAAEENLSILADTLHMDLELEARETNVGQFRADILCRNAGGGSWVLIENQFNRTDHSHLGQLSSPVRMTASGSSCARERRELQRLSFLMAPRPGVKGFRITPQSTPFAASLTFDDFILVSVCRDGVPVSNEPFPNVLAVASHGTHHAAVLVVSLDHDSNSLAANRLNQCALDTLSVVEPVPVLVSRYLIPLGRV